MATPTATDAATAFIQTHTTTEDDVQIIFGAECPLCLDVYEDEKPLRITGIEGCNHVYGENCLNVLLNTNPQAEKKCPLCRTVWVQGQNQLGLGARRNAVDYGSTPTITDDDDEGDQLQRLLELASRRSRAARTDRARGVEARAQRPNELPLFEITSNDDDSNDDLGSFRPRRPIELMRARRHAQHSSNIDFHTELATMRQQSHDRGANPALRLQLPPPPHNPDSIRLGREGRGDGNITAGSVAAEQRQLDDIRIRAGRGRNQIQKNDPRAGDRHTEARAQDRQSRSEPATGAGITMGAFEFQPSHNTGAQSAPRRGGRPRRFVNSTARIRNYRRQGQQREAMAGNNNEMDVQMMSSQENSLNSARVTQGPFAGLVNLSTSMRTFTGASHAALAPPPCPHPSLFGFSTGVNENQEGNVDAMDKDTDMQVGAQDEEQVVQTSIRADTQSIRAMLRDERNRDMRTTFLNSREVGIDSKEARLNEREQRLHHMEQMLNEREQRLNERQQRLERREAEFPAREKSMNNMMDTIKRQATERDDLSRKQREEMDRL